MDRPIFTSYVELIPIHKTFYFCYIKLVECVIKNVHPYFMYSFNIIETNRNEPIIQWKVGKSKIQTKSFILNYGYFAQLKLSVLALHNHTKLQ